jgi:phage terminase small subunit
MSLDGLTFKQRLFVEAYLGESRGNATDAARVAGYRNPNQVGPRLSVKVGIQAAIDARLDSAALTTSRLLAILSDHATASIEDFGRVDESGFVLDLARAGRRGRLHCIKKLKPVKVEVDDGQTDDHGRPIRKTVTRYEIELHDAQAAIEKLGKYRGMWKADDRGTHSDAENFIRAVAAIAAQGRPPGDR